MRPTVYICSPYTGGDIQFNLQLARKYAAKAVESNYAPIVPHLYVPDFVDEVLDREIGMDIAKSIAIMTDYFWICGERYSRGMRDEIATRVKNNPTCIYEANFREKLFYLHQVTNFSRFWHDTCDTTIFMWFCYPF